MKNGRKLKWKITLHWTFPKPDILFYCSDSLLNRWQEMQTPSKVLLKQFSFWNLKQQQLIVQLNAQDQSQKKMFSPWLFVHQQIMSFKLNCKFLNETFKTFVSFKYKILPQLLTKSNHEEKNSPTYRSQKGVFVHSHQVTGKHLWPQHNFQKVIRHKHSPLGVLKFSFHTEIFVNTEETLSDAQFTLTSTVPSRSFHSHSLVCLPRFPAGSCLIQLKNKRQKTQIYSNHSNLTQQVIG